MALIDRNPATERIFAGKDIHTGTTMNSMGRRTIYYSLKSSDSRAFWDFQKMYCLGKYNEERLY